MASLEHPCTEALFEDAAREFQRLPVEAKRSRSSRRWWMQELRRQLVEEGPAPSPEMPDENHLAVTEVLMKLDDHIERYKAGLAERENR